MTDDFPTRADEARQAWQDRMTPNKLPPLPELYGPLTGAEEASLRGRCMTSLRYVTEDYPESAKDITNWLTHVENERNRLFDLLSEALRQSQSLPAGAVAGLVGKWRHQSETFAAAAGCHAQDEEHDDEAYCNGISAGYSEASDDLSAALQADAREKGEDAIEAMAQVIYEAHSEQYESLVLPVWGPLLPEGTANHWRHIARKVLATQPAQASESTVLVGGVAHTYRDDVIKPVEAEAVAHMRRSVTYKAVDGRFDGERIISERQVYPDDVPLYTHPQPVTPAGGEVEPVAEIGRLWSLVYVGSDPLADVVKRHRLAIGTKLYTHPPVADAALVRDAERWRMLNRLKGFVGWESMPGYETQRNLTGYHSRDYGSLDAAMDAAIDAALNQRCAELPRGHSIEDAKHAILKKGRGNED